MSSSDGPPPWAVTQIPSGETFTAVKMAKMQNKDVWVSSSVFVSECLIPLIPSNRPRHILV